MILVEKKPSIISTEKFSMVISLSKIFFKLNNYSQFKIKNKTIFVLAGTGRTERKLLNFKRSSKTFTQDKKAISNGIYLLQPSVICFHSTLWYQPIGTKRNPWVAVSLQSPIYYSNNTSTLPLTLQLCYKPLAILKTLIKNK